MYLSVHREDHKGSQSALHSVLQHHAHVEDSLLCPDSLPELHQQPVALRAHCVQQCAHDQPLCVQGWHPIHHVCTYGDLEVVEWLSEQYSVFLTAEDEDCWQPMHITCLYGLTPRGRQVAGIAGGGVANVWEQGGLAANQHCM